MAFSPDNRTLATASWDGTVKLWDLEAPAGDSLAERGTIRLADRVPSIAFSPDGRLLAIGQPNGIALYDPSTRKEVYPFKRTVTPVPALAFSRDSRWLISAAATDPTAGADPAIADADVLRERIQRIDAAIDELERRIDETAG